MLWADWEFAWVLAHEHLNGGKLQTVPFGWADMDAYIIDDNADRLS